MAAILLTISNYIWVIIKFIAYEDAAYIRVLTVRLFAWVKIR